MIELHRTDTLGQSQICLPRLAAFEEADARIDELLRGENGFSLKDLAVNGNDMKAIGLKGNAIAKMLQACLDAVLDESIQNNRALLMMFAKSQAAIETGQILLDFESDHKKVT